MFHGKIQVRRLDEALRVIYALKDECEIHFGEDSIRIPVMDESQSASVEVNLSEDAFEEYETDGGKLGLSIERLEQILSNAADEDLIELEYDDEQRRVQIDVSGQQYQLALVTLESIKTPVSGLDIDYTTWIEIAEQEFSQAVKAADMFASSAGMRYDSESSTFIIEASGDSHLTNREMSGEDLISVSGEHAEAKFNLEFLSELAGAIPSGNTLSISMRTDRPALFEYEVADANGTVEYTLAPRIEPSS